MINWMTECESKVGVRLEGKLRSMRFCKAGARLKSGWEAVAVDSPKVAERAVTVAVAVAARKTWAGYHFFFKSSARALPVRVRAPLNLCNFQHAGGFLYFFCSLLGAAMAHGLPPSSEPCSSRRPFVNKPFCGQSGDPAQRPMMETTCHITTATGYRSALWTASLLKG